MNKNNVSMHSTYSPSGEIEPGDQSLSDQNRPVKSESLTIAQPHSRENLSQKVVVGDHLSGKPSGLSGSRGFDMDAVRLQRAGDSRLEARSCTRGCGVGKGRSLLREAFVFASGKVRSLA